MTTQESSPAFQFYVKEWRSSRAVLRMTFAQRGMYLEMLLEQWENYSVPDDPAAVAALIGGTVEEWTDAWPVLRRKFCDRRAKPRDRDTMPTSHDAARKIINVKLEEIRAKLKRYRVVARKGGQARAVSAKRGNNGTYSPAVSPAVTPAVAPAAQPAVSSTPIPSPSPTPSPSASPSPTASAKERPRLRNTRFAVHRWMIERLIGELGPHANNFDLDSWLMDRIPVLAEAERGIVPDWFQWLKTETLAEAVRRGLPIAASKLSSVPSGRTGAGEPGKYAKVTS